MRMFDRTLVIAAVLGVAAAAAAPAASADLAAGEKVFKKCKACHTVEPGGKNKIGPNLAGVMGREAAMVDGFKYSKALKESGLIWDDENLAQYLANPKTFLKGNKMAFPGLKKEEDVANVIAYMKEAGGG
jgi:cytochrome c